MRRVQRSRTGASARVPSGGGKVAETPVAGFRWLAAMEPLSSTRFIGRAAPVRVLLLWGHQDRLVPPALANDLYRAAGDAKEARWYDSGHGLPPVAFLDMMDWLARQIGTSPVTAEEREKVAGSAP